MELAQTRQKRSNGREIVRQLGKEEQLTDLECDRT